MSLIYLEIIFATLAFLFLTAAIYFFVNRDVYAYRKKVRKRLEALRTDGDGGRSSKTDPDPELRGLYRLNLLPY
jgi:hypothetical protein